MKRSIAHREAGGRVRAPASKSSMQRAVACALLASPRASGGGDGGAAEPSIIRSPSRSADCLAALGAAEGLGAAIEDRGDSFSILGIGALHRAAGEGGVLSLSCGESGLCMRMFSPIAALFDAQVELAAEGSLKRRTVGMIAGPLRELGASCDTAEGFPPVLVRGPLRGGRAKVDGRESSQLLTGLLVALPLAERDSELEVDGLASRGYVDLTIDTMRAFGVRAERDLGYRRFSIPGKQTYRPADFTVEGDWSGAAFLLVAGAIAARLRPVEVEALDSRSHQPDRAILDALRDAGAEVSIVRAEGADGLVSVSRRALAAFSFDATDCPDLFPPLACLAMACEGESRIKGVGRLRGKESDRATALSEELGRLGARIAVAGDEMLVRGGQLRSGLVDSRGDHRIAMAAAVASLLADGPVAVEGAECVAKSWPTFYEDLARVAR